MLAPKIHDFFAHTLMFRIWEMNKINTYVSNMLNRECFNQNTAVEHIQKLEKCQKEKLYSLHTWLGNNMCENILEYQLLEFESAGWLSCNKGKSGQFLNHEK